MGLFKDSVTRGIYYNSIGLTDYMTWMKNMLDYCGPEMRPYMKDIRKWSIAIQNSLDVSKAVKLNCWQFMGCRVQKKDGFFRKTCGSYICPVFSENKFDGVHGGINGGRACWMVSRTICYGTIQGTYEEKHTCMACDFYRSVAEEENDLISPHLLKAMLL
jgi:hypothetical protein